MSDAKFAKYEELAVGKFTKDGHTMFSQDVIYDLNRKSYLEKVMLEQQTEINELNNHRAGQNSCIKQQREGINELKAMVNALRDAARLYHEGYKSSELEEANSIMIMSPAQCLANVKADAVDEFAMHIGLTGKALSNYVNNLRKTMITTSSGSSLSEVINKINEEL